MDAATVYTKVLRKKKNDKTPKKWMAQTMSMNYQTTLIAAAQPDAPPQAITDLLAVAAAEQIPHGDAIADRLALRAVLTAPRGPEIDAADEAKAEATKKLEAARRGLQAAQDELDRSEAGYAVAVAAASKITIRSRECLKALERPAVAAAAKMKDSE